MLQPHLNTCRFLNSKNTTTNASKLGWRMKETGPFPFTPRQFTYFASCSETFTWKIESHLKWRSILCGGISSKQLSVQLSSLECLLNFSPNSRKEIFTQHFVHSKQIHFFYTLCTSIICLYIVWFDFGSDVFHNMATNFWGVIFCMSKFLDFGDTVFLILSKKPVRFLHW